MIAVGRIIKPHGIRGDVKAECFMDSPDCFIQIRKVYIDKVAEPFIVTRASVQKGCVILHLKGIEDMTNAELYRNATVYCNESDLPQPEKGRYYVSDIIGCTVIAGEKTYGIVTDILQYGSADVVVLDDNGKRLSFPWVKGLEEKIDIESKRFQVKEGKFKEVLLDED